MDKKQAYELFSALEVESKEAIVFKKMYFKICDEDLAAAILLSQIIYWFGKGKDGTCRAKTIHNGKNCIVKQRTDWLEECCITLKQYNRVIPILKEKGLIETEIHRSPFHENETAIFIFLNIDCLMEHINKYLSIESLVHPGVPKGNTQVCQKGTPGHIYTEIIDKDYINAAGAKAPAPPISISSSKKEKERKTIYGKYHNVYLTDKQYEELLKQYGQSMLTKLIEDVSSYQDRSGKKYQGFVSAINTFADRNNQQEKNAIPSANNAFVDKIKKRFKQSEMINGCEIVSHSNEVIIYVGQAPSKLNYSEQDFEKRFRDMLRTLGIEIDI